MANGPGSKNLVRSRFFPAGQAKPAALNVNPCALLLKPREGVDESAPLIERFKARLILDLLRGRVNERLPEVGVAYGTVDLAVSRMCRNDYLFVIDVQDSFFNWRVRPDDSYELGFFSPARSQFGKYDFVPNGISIGPGVNYISVKELLRLCALHVGVELTGFMDDLLGRGGLQGDAWAAMESAVGFFINVGVPVSDKPSGLRPHQLV